MQGYGFSNEPLPIPYPSPSDDGNGTCFECPPMCNACEQANMANCTQCTYGYMLIFDNFLQEKLCVEMCRYRMIHVSVLLLLIAHVWMSSAWRCIYAGYRSISARYRTMTMYTGNPHTPLHRSLTCITFLVGWSLSMVIIDEINEVRDDMQYFHNAMEYGHGGHPTLSIFQLISCLTLPLIVGLSFTKGKDEDDGEFKEFGAGWRCSLRCSDRAAGLFAWFFLVLNVLACLIHGSFGMRDPSNQFDPYRMSFHRTFLAFAVIIFLIFVVFLVCQLMLWRENGFGVFGLDKVHKASFITEGMLMYSLTWMICIGAIQRANEQRNHGQYCGGYFGLAFLIIDIILMFLHPWIQARAGRHDGWCPRFVYIQPEGEGSAALNSSGTVAHTESASFGQTAAYSNIDTKQ